MPRTPGQLTVAKCGNVLTSDRDRWVAHARRRASTYTNNADDDFAFIAATWNSYDKSCGDLAQKCAEADLLGQLLSLTVLELERHQDERGFCACGFCVNAAPLVAMAF